MHSGVEGVVLQGDLQIAIHLIIISSIEIPKYRILSIQPDRSSHETADM